MKSSYRYNFEKLEIWQLSRQLIYDVYQVSESFPKNERYGLESQLKRSAISVASNIAEGSTRTSPKDKRRFIEIAYGSSIELLNQLIISNDLNYLKTDQIEILRIQIGELTNKINAFKKSII